MDRQRNKHATNYALSNALSAASNNYLENRPDPIQDRVAYEAWYYSLDSGQQQAEWDLYYKNEEKRKNISPDAVIEHKEHHAVSKDFAHDHITPSSDLDVDLETSDTISPEIANKLAEATGLNSLKDIQGAEVSNYDGGMIAVKRPKANIKPLAKEEPEIEVDKPNITPKQTIKNSIYQSAMSERKKKKSNPFKPLFAAITVGGFVMLMAYNQVVFAQVKQYVRPGSQLNTPVIVTPESNVCEGQSNNVFIPKINVNTPVVYDEKSWDNDKIDDALERGVVHYGTTAVPGQAGNNVILGHSSGNLLNQGDFKYEFVLLDALENGDTFTMCYEGERYVYKIFRKEIIDPSDLTYVYQNQEGVPDDSRHVTTLITCHPPGTSWKRLIVQGVQISPTPDSNTEQAEVVGIENADIKEVPSDSKSFWSTILDWF